MFCQDGRFISNARKFLNYRCNIIDNRFRYKYLALLVIGFLGHLTVGIGLASQPLSCTVWVTGSVWHIIHQNKRNRSMKHSVTWFFIKNILYWNFYDTWISLFCEWRICHIYQSYQEDIFCKCAIWIVSKIDPCHEFCCIHSAHVTHTMWSDFCHKFSSQSFHMSCVVEIKFIW